ncbi:glycosyltransferase (plasmid) [Leuconostoc carnosum]|uniref:Glycosyltransferase n=1 Tax=Leuconostoc carnosum TaxID=1252 RepID=A0AAE6ILH0_LEUCA|nr:glycosyltransferase [Leuconostoc carnosum]QEA34123.1 glycosyltransferase [Leuconostoc carnosum]
MLKKMLGIAKATNDGIKMHETNGLNWVLTLDQDSTVLPDYISQLVDDEDNGVCMFAPI